MHTFDELSTPFVSRGKDEIVPFPQELPTHPQNLWNLQELFRQPETFEAPKPFQDAVAGQSIQPLMIATEPHEGHPAKFFAWVGFPEHADAQHKVPGIVLVHGGGGTAFRYWVKLWNERGYAAIALDAFGHLPQLNGDMDDFCADSHEWSGAHPPQISDAIDKPEHDQWSYQAVAAVIRAHSLLRTFPQVDADRIGITGISWGGYLTCIVSGLDSRFRFAAPIYGCGFLGQDSSWHNDFLQLGQERAEKWLRLWDPSRYLVHATMPMFFCNGTNDPHFYTEIWNRSTLLPPTAVTRSYKIRMHHDHAPSGDPPEVRLFADSMLQGKPALPALSEMQQEGRQLTATVTLSTGSIKEAHLVYTQDLGFWPDRLWCSTPAAWDASADTLTATAPEAATAAYLAVTDSRDAWVSTPLAFF